jgi:hypothetical protein
LALAGSVAIGQAQTYTNIIISSFDTSSDPYINGVEWWGLDLWTNSWDGTQNCPDPLVPAVAGSGALKITLNWIDTSAAPGWTGQGPQFVFLDGINLNPGGPTAGWDTAFNIGGTPVNGYYYDLDFDYKFDPASARSVADGSFGIFEVGFAMPGWSQTWVWNTQGNGITNQGWTHVHQYIDPTLPGISQIGGLAFYFPWQADYSLPSSSPFYATNSFYTNASQVTTFWLDNIVFTADLTKPLAPPTLSLKPVSETPGLNINTTSAAGEYDRDDIATVNTYSWVGNGSTPVTYSLTIGKYPGTNNPYFQTQIFLCSGAGGAPPPATDTAPDWDQPNCIFLQIQNNPNGTASGSLRWKTNEPAGNGLLFGSGYIGALTEPAGPLGTWSLTFVNDTNVTLTTPSGLNTNWVFPDDTALQTYFPQGSVVAYFGCDPNATANEGQAAVLTEVKISGLTPAIDDHFTEATLDPNTWNIVAAQPTGITLGQTNVHWALSWTLPDLGYQMQSAPSVLGPWTVLSIATNATQSGPTKSVLIPDSALPAGNSAYFQMVKRSATQLQVLLPGESNAPGTGTGKTGTPDPQTTGVPFNLTINACDATWNIATTCSDTVMITSTDTSAFTPSNTALVNGTVTIIGDFEFGTPGTWTITATDVTDTNVLAGTSSPVSVPQ